VPRDKEPFLLIQFEGKEAFGCEPPCHELKLHIPVMAKMLLSTQYSKIVKFLRWEWVLLKLDGMKVGVFHLISEKSKLLLVSLSAIDASVTVFFMGEQAEKATGTKSTMLQIPDDGVNAKALVLADLRYVPWSRRAREIGSRI
jgi:hypothetical protein